MPKAKLFPLEDPTGRDLGDHVFIFCPGCDGHHSLRVRMPKFPTAQEIEERNQNKAGLWQWNGDVENPTFTPSLSVLPSFPNNRCHSFIKDGNIQYLNDCHHHLKGKTIPLPDIDI